jgi:hypothetical protein
MRSKQGLTIIAIFCCLRAIGQTTPNNRYGINQRSDVDSARQVDLIDVASKMFNSDFSPEQRKLPKKLNFSIIPSAGYTLSTGFAADLTGNVAFFTGSSHTENLSNIQGDISYDTKSQRLFISRSNVWTEDNRYKIVTDIRIEKFPTTTYGLGTFTNNGDADNIFYNYVRVYSTIYKFLLPGLYGGAGYNLDYRYGITEDGNLNGEESDFKRYGLQSKETSSGINLDLLYDTRKNALNPLGGTFLNLTFRDNATVAGSSSNWSSVQLDMRKYLKLWPESNNILAFWGIVGYTAGKVPYLDLPATGEDEFDNTGRGYIKGRFRGKDILYLESEYRFSITNNGLLGAVLFANGESFSEMNTNTFKRIAPAAGTGIRIKVNKHSDTNICIDYAVGTGGSKGFFVNLGEVF